MDVYTIMQSLRILDLVGCHPGKKGKVQLVQYVVAATGYTLILLMSALVLVFQGTNITVEVVSDIFVKTSCFAICLGKTAMVFSSKQALLDLLDKMQYQFWKIEDVTDPEEKKSYERIMANLKLIFHLYIALFSIWLIGLCNFKSLPVRTLNFHLGIPYYVLLVVQNVYCLFVPITVIAVDTLIRTTLKLTLIQYKMLNAEMEKLFLIGRNLETHELDEIFRRRIKKLVDHHNFLFRYTDLINESYAMNILIYVAQMVVLLCFTMYHLSTMNALDSSFFRDALGTILSFYTFGIHYCVAAQDVIDEAEKTKISAYFARWYEHPKFAKAILMIMKRDQLEVKVSAGGIAKLNLETCLACYRLAVSYYTFLRTATLAKDY